VPLDAAATSGSEWPAGRSRLTSNRVDEKSCVPFLSEKSCLPFSASTGVLVFG